MHIHIVPNRKASPTILLRESYREGRKVKKWTLANLSSLPMAQIEIIRTALNGVDMQSMTESFEITRSLAQGHVQAVALMMKHLGLASLIASQPCQERPRAGHDRRAHPGTVHEARHHPLVAYHDLG